MMHLILCVHKMLTMIPSNSLHCNCLHLKAKRQCCFSHQPRKTQTKIRCETRANGYGSSLSKVKRPERGLNPSSPSNVEVKNEWSSNSTLPRPPNAFVTCVGTTLPLPFYTCKYFAVPCISHMPSQIIVR